MNCNNILKSTISINSVKDLFDVVNDKGKIGQKIDKILYYGFNYSRNMSPARIAVNLQINELFKAVYFESLGYFMHEKVKQSINDYSNLLRFSIYKCEFVLLPIVEALKKHELALTHLSDDKKRTSQIIVEIDSTAKDINIEYSRIKDKFSMFNKKIVESIVDFHKEFYVIYKKMNDNRDENLSLILSNSNLKICSAFKTMFKILNALENMRYFWKKTQNLSQTLMDSSLLTSMNLLEEKNYMQDSDQEIVFSNIATERMLELKEDFFIFANSFNENNVKQDFKQSYLKWLALAKINIEIKSVMNSALSSIMITQLEIAEIEKDSLVIALKN